LNSPPKKATDIHNIIKALSSPDLNVRLAGIRELAESDISNKFKILERLLQKDRHPTVQNEVKKLLSQADLFAENTDPAERMNPEQQKIFRALKSSDEKLVHRAFVYLVKAGRTDLLNHMIECEKRFEDPFFRFCNLRLICRLKNRLNFLPKYLSDQNPEVIHKTLEILAHDSSPKAIYILLESTSTLKALSVKKAWKCLESIEPERIKPLLKKMLESEFPVQRLIVAEALRFLKPVYACELLNTLTGDENHDVSECAWKAVEEMSELGSEQAVALLEKVGAKTGSQSLLRAKRRAYHQDKNTDFNLLTKLLKENDDPKEISRNIQKIGFCEVDNRQKINILLHYLQHEDARVRADCVEALSCCRLSPAEFELLHQQLEHEENNRVIGNIILTLCENPETAELYKQTVTKTIKKLCQSPEKNFKLTGIFCIENLLDESHAEQLFHLAVSDNRQIRERALQSLENWSLNSIAIKSELDRRKINGLIGHQEEEEELDEFID
jgi:HEAT repeat protein